MAEIEIRKLTECTLQQAVKAWNDGFAGYAFDATTTPDLFVKRMAEEELSPELSVVAFIQNEPAGIALGGIRRFAGRKIGWNGGTGVAAKHRGTGVGQRLIAAAAEIFREAGVGLATLEALSDNWKAIALYEKMGYIKIDNLEHLSLKGPREQPFYFSADLNYTVKRIPPVQAGNLSFYKGLNPWQTQWQNARGGEAAVVLDEAGEAVGYAYFNTVYDPDGKLTSKVLLQCEAAPGHPEAFPVMKLLLAYVFGDMTDDINRMVPNLPRGGAAMTGTLLCSLGFVPVVRQVYMTKEL